MPSRPFSDCSQTSTPLQGCSWRRAWDADAEVHDHAVAGVRGRRLGELFTGEGHGESSGGGARPGPGSGRSGARWNTAGRVGHGARIARAGQGGLVLAGGSAPGGENAT